ncbi:dockerin type I repeat-containing protein [Ruminococcus albus]|uniref:dockerin type I repeat-containing protein n=1 Tax=Ruminococcus albus TaxID=1264 RepID=UPI000467D172|nr:dockerin type I repeat-containing protein [Ruminococcus albus]
MDLKRSKKLKRIVSGMLSLAMITSMSAVLPANAEEESSQDLYSLTDNSNSYTSNADIVSDDVVTDEEDTYKIIQGDVNNDGEINSDDTNLLHRWLACLVGDNELDLVKADVNFDGEVDVIDLVELSRLEKHDQTFTYEVENEDCAVTEVQVAMECTGDLSKTMQVESIMDEDAMCSEVVGLVGEPFSIETTSDFNNATITFKVDQSKLEDTNFEDLMFLWYDRDNDKFVELETEHNAGNSTVSVETTHFSDYMLVDANKWVARWRGIESLYRTSLSSKITFRSPSVFFEVINTRNKNLLSDSLYLEVLKDLSESSSPFRRGFYTNRILTNYDGLSTSGKFTPSLDDIIDDLSDPSVWFWEVTNLLEQIRTSTSDLYIPSSLKDGSRKAREITIVLVLDDYYVSNHHPTETIQQILAHNTVFYFVDFRGEHDSLLDSIAKGSNGEYFNYSPENIEKLKKILSTPIEHTSTTQYYKDTDEDGFFDVEEINGWMYKSNGTTTHARTNPEKKDSDGDGLDDNVEMNPTLIYEASNDPNIPDKYYYKMYSDPSTPDTDGDYLNDKIDVSPLTEDPIKITDVNLDDSNSIYGMNPPLDSVSDLTDGELRRISVDGGDEFKNCYKFTRKTGNKSFRFILAPTKDTDYKITITNTELENVKLTVHKDGCKFERINGTNSVSYTLPLKNGHEYEIEIINNSKIADTCEVTIAQDNWVYAPNGAFLDYTDEDSIYTNVVYYLSDSTVKGIIENYALYGEGDELKVDDFDSKTEEQNNKACEHYAQIFHDAFAGLSNDKLSKILSIIGPTNTAAGVVVVIPSVTARLGEQLAGKCGVGITIFGAYLTAVDLIEEFDKSKIKKALYEGKYNIKMAITSYYRTDYPSYQKIYECDIDWAGWENNGYINRYADPTLLGSLFGYTSYRIKNIVPLNIYAPHKDENGEWIISVVENETGEWIPND